MARRRSLVCVCVGVALLCVFVLCVCVGVQQRSRRLSRRCPDGAHRWAAVAADSGTCSRIGRDVLQQGGSAVDGAIAALLCTSLVNPQSMGIGGGSMFMVMDASGEVKIINSREKVPLKFNPELLQSCKGTRTGVQWVGVPGELRGYQLAHRLYGKLPWADLFAPTIRLARGGLPVLTVLGSYLSNNVTADPALRKHFSDKDGKLLKTGDTVKYEKLADTLEVIAKQGADAFYSGKVAEDLVRDIQEAGGTITMEDLASYNAVVTDAWNVSLGEYKMHIAPPPAGGALLSLVLNILKGYGLNSTSDQQLLTFHRYAEAFKFVNAQKKHIRDPNVISPQTARRLTEDGFATYIRSLIGSRAVDDPQYYNVTPRPDSLGTTHVSVLDRDGLAVSVTSSINLLFGSQVLSARTGVILNNQLSDFCGRADRIVSGEQPPSSMSPAVLQSPWRTLVIGSTGGDMITTGMASALMHHLWFGKRLNDSIAAPLFFVNSRNQLMFEPKFDEKLIKGLEALGHKRAEVTRFYNVVNAVEREGDCIHAVSDKRKNGEAAGY